MIRVHERRRAFRMTLTPMIDVVFLLLIFFMLAARFGMDSSMPLGAGAPSGAYDGPPRLVTVGADALRLNGRVVAESDLAEGLRPLVSDADDLIVLQPGENATLQRLVDVLGDLRAAGFSNLVILE